MIRILTYLHRGTTFNATTR